ncbi:biliverdin-producing heme oxygenase [uncultured Reyranella sp.]|uniref:biliverdin-producing heme oxygenase n=1 Tax=uncultured Reyranella sp. TaxID=735512 RepID=UPI00259D05CA|nr:biliverdin-producing heme oxygenase [uncultured Reyranella sp.]
MRLDTISAAPGRPSARQMLRSATATLHAEVDARFTGPFATDRSAYEAFLAALSRAVLPLERALERGGVERLLPDWTERRRADALRQDLCILGVAVPPVLDVSVTTDEARLFGRLYVLEGSRLGGKLLVRRAAESDDPQVRAATHYLGHGAESDFWRGFLQRLESSAAVKGSPQRTLLGAREAFGLFVRDPAHV